MRAAIIIPARHASTRLPGKPLLAETGKPLIQYTYEQAQKAVQASRVIVATDDENIAEAVQAFGGEAVMTRSDHETGSTRVAEVAEYLEEDVIVNLQGDEPEIDPGYIDKAIDLVVDEQCFAATLACPFPKNARNGPGSPADPSAVKVILGEALGEDRYKARYFTRTITPYPRDDKGAVKTPEKYYLHLGVYAFTKEKLLSFARGPMGALERAEKLEQLRILEMGEVIAIGIVPAAAPGIDTREDYDAFLLRISR